MQLLKDIKIKPAHIIIIALFIFFLSLYIISQSNSEKRSNIVFTPTPFPAQQTSYILMGNIGTGNESQKAVAHGIEHYCRTKDCAAAFIAGNIIYENGVKNYNDKQFKTKFEDIYKNLSFPFYVAFGNRDYKGCSKCYIDYEKKSKKWEMPSAYYKKSFKNIDFFVIDTEKFDTKQQQWLEKEINGSIAKSKVVVGHRPIVTYDVEYTTEKWDGKNQLKNIICNKAHFYVSGQSNVLEDVGKLEGCSVQQLISGAGGSYSEQVTENNNNLFSYSKNGFLVIDVPKKDSKEAISYKFLDKDAQILYPSFEAF